MAWPWSSTPAAPAPSKEASDLPPPQVTPKPPSQPSKTLSRDEIAERELQSFFKEIEADTHPGSSKYNRVPRAPPTPIVTKDGNEPLSEQLLPRKMSCRTAFDEAFYCNSFGGRFNDLYRYGNLQSCSENWDKFWFCMRTRAWSDKEKEKAVMDHYRVKEAKKYQRNDSSENVWKSREKKMEWGEAFSAPFPKFEGTDEEWNQKQAEWRKGKVDGTMD